MEKGRLFMLDNTVRKGDRIKLIAIQGEENTKKEASYYSRVIEIMDSNRIKVAMPIVNGKYVVLDSLKQYKMEFITRKGIFACEARIIRRFKEKLNFFVVFELMSELEKLQRREYYRLECVFDIRFRRSMDGNIMQKDEDDDDNAVEQREDEQVEGQEPKLVYKKRKVPWHAAIVTNISGGGVRFNSREALNKGEKVLLKMHLKFDDDEGDYEIPARVIHSAEVPNRPDIFEARVQFTDISTQDREDIIRFVFDEERRIRRRKKGLV